MNRFNTDVFKVSNVLSNGYKRLEITYGKIYIRANCTMQLKDEGTSRQSNVILYVIHYKSPF